MIRVIPICVIILTISNVFGQDSSINDGPYIFIDNQKLTSKSIVNGAVVIEELESNSFEIEFSTKPSSFNQIDTIVALSDIHGQYDLAIEILQNNGIIDSNLDWSLGKGHLVIAGDIFDRGGKVTEVLWLIYKLEKQAEEAGGNLHYLLGNHEYMVLHNDLRYLHEKYPEVSELLAISYDELYGKNTVLGRWLRSKHTILKINEHLFLHGGISKDFISKAGVDFNAINATIRASIEREKEEMKSTDFYSTYYGSNGPIWYRGYFYDPIPESRVDSILVSVSSAHIVVGHCSNEEVVSRYNKKVLGVDSSIKRGKYGEILFITPDGFYRGTKNGERLKF